MADSVTFDGRNTAEVREWINADPGRDEHSTWFITRSQSGPTSSQAWRYVKGDADWGPDVIAAVFDPRGGWRPVRRGDTIERQGSGYGVREAS